VQLPMPGETQVEALTRINTAEFVENLGLGWLPHGRGVLAKVCRPAARQISQDMARFDRMVAEQGLQRGSRSILDELIGDLEVRGADHVCERGPLLIAANHPGLCDVLTIFASVQRDDLLVVAADYPLLRALTGFNASFIFVPRSAHLRRQSFHSIIAHLRSGGAVLLLPAGEIEPDPAVSDRAARALERWSPSLGLVVHKVPGLTVVPAVVSGVLAPEFQHHPLTLLRRRTADRQQLGATLQVLARASASMTVRLQYGRPLHREALVSPGANARAITRVIVDNVRLLMRPAEQDWSETPAMDSVPAPAFH
jgi:acyltransferase-like protein